MVFLYFFNFTDIPLSLWFVRAYGPDHSVVSRTELFWSNSGVICVLALCFCL